MNWKTLASMEDWKMAYERSKTAPVVIFKHSTRCSVSRMALRLTEQRWDLPEKIEAFLLDLLIHRDVSDAIASDLKLQHQSPQLIYLVNGKVVHHANHSGIDPVDLKTYL